MRAHSACHTHRGLLGVRLRAGRECGSGQRGWCRGPAHLPDEALGVGLEVLGRVGRRLVVHLVHGQVAARTRERGSATVAPQVAWMRASPGSKCREEWPAGGGGLVGQAVSQTGARRTCDHPWPGLIHSSQSRDLSASAKSRTWRRPRARGSSPGTARRAGCTRSAASGRTPPCSWTGCAPPGTQARPSDQGTAPPGILAKLLAGGRHLRPLHTIASCQRRAAPVRPCVVRPQAPRKNASPGPVATAAARAPGIVEVEGAGRHVVAQVLGRRQRRRQPPTASAAPCARRASAGRGGGARGGRPARRQRCGQRRILLPGKRARQAGSTQTCVHE